MEEPKTYVEMYHEAGKIADSKYNYKTDLEKWVKERDNWLNALCFGEICEHVINKNQ